MEKYDNVPVPAILKETKNRLQSTHFAQGTTKSQKGKHKPWLFLQLTKEQLFDIIYLC